MVTGIVLTFTIVDTLNYTYSEQNGLLLRKILGE